MIVPTSVTGAFLVVALVIPGFVFGTIRSIFRPPRGVQDTELSSRVAFAVMMSVIFDSAYLIVVGIVTPGLVSEIAGAPVATFAASPLGLGLAALIGAVVVPATMAAGFYVRLPRGEDGKRRPATGYRNFPTAWDRAAPGLGGTFVRVRMPDGSWVGGWYSAASAIGTYPHSRDLYIEKQYTMLADGRFEHEVPSSNGVWLSIGDQHVVEWLSSDHRSTGKDGA